MTHNAFFHFLVINRRALSSYWLLPNFCYWVCHTTWASRRQNNTIPMTRHNVCLWHVYWLKTGLHECSLTSALGITTWLDHRCGETDPPSPPHTHTAWTAVKLRGLAYSKQCSKMAVPVAVNCIQWWFTHINTHNGNMLRSFLKRLNKREESMRPLSCLVTDQCGSLLVIQDSPLH